MSWRCQNGRSRGVSFCFVRFVAVPSKPGEVECTCRVSHPFLPCVPYTPAGLHLLCNACCSSTEALPLVVVTGIPEILGRSTTASLSCSQTWAKRLEFHPDISVYRGEKGRLKLETGTPAISRMPTLTSTVCNATAQSF